jgi:hypothetical protein
MTLLADGQSGFPVSPGDDSAPLSSGEARLYIDSLPGRYGVRSYG